MKIFFDVMPEFSTGLPDGVESIGFNADNKAVFELRDGVAMPEGARPAVDADLIGLPNVAASFGKMMTQNAIAAKFGGGDHARSSMSLVGKTANALSAALNIHMQVYQRLAAAQSLADVQAAVEPALPLMQRVGAMLAAGELRSVQHVQGVSDEDAVIEGLLAMTQAAAVIAAQTQEKNDAN
jgi:hypothetical protein